MIKVAEGYDLEEIMDTDDTGYDNGEPVLIQEVEVEYEQLFQTDCAAASTYRSGAEKP